MISIMPRLIRAPDMHRPPAQSIFGSNDEEESLSDEDISGTNMTDNSREEEDQLEAATLEETADACW